MRLLLRVLFSFIGICLLIVVIQQLQLREKPSTAVWIAFASNMDGPYEIYRMLPDGRDLQRLTFDAGHNWQPVWSPDGKWIAYSSYQDGGYLIYRVPAEGGDPIPITQVDAYQMDHFNPIWSRDGKSIIYRALLPDRRSGVVYQTDIRHFTPRFLLSTSHYQDGYVAWSPDGTRLSVQSRLGDAWSIYTLELETKTQHALTTAESRAHVAPQWSPDGRLLAYFHSPTWEQSHLHTIDVESGAVRQIGTNQGLGLKPMWSPNGKWIVYDEWISGFYHIHLANMETGTIQRLTPQANQELAPAWSPDGQWIAFVRRFGGDDDEAIYRMRPDGRDRQRLTTARGLYEPPTWSPMIDMAWRPLRLLGVGFASIGMVWVVGIKSSLAGFPRVSVKLV